LAHIKSSGLGTCRGDQRYGRIMLVWERMTLFTKDQM